MYVGVEGVTKLKIPFLGNKIRHFNCSLVTYAISSFVTLLRERLRKTYGGELNVTCSFLSTFSSLVEYSVSE